MDDSLNVFKNKISDLEVVLYCAGLHGRIIYEFLKQCGIKVNCFMDTDKNKWGEMIIDDIKCVNPFEMENTVKYGIICVGKKNYNQVKQIVQDYKLFEILEINNVVDCLIKDHRNLFLNIIKKHASLDAADVFYDMYPNRKFIFNNKRMEIKFERKIAIYTSVFGNYDRAHYSKKLGERYVQIYISDQKPMDLPAYYKWLDAKKIIPQRIISPVKRNRYIKMNPHLFLSEYEYSIYLDGNVVLNDDVPEFEMDSRSGISVFMHPMRECIYYEALSIVNFKRVDVDDVCKQIKKYMDEGMPLRYGLAEMPVIARFHNREECIAVMNIWWNEFESGAQRDQLSFMYAMWKNHLTAEDLGCLGYDVRKYKKINFFEHVRESRNIKNEMGSKDWG